ncbi:uncharacterized protein LOC116250036 [Nymphaea colorata]|nr:uncharacterized protein LOC116250036 [Nymphaea colorata]
MVVLATTLDAPLLSRKEISNLQPPCSSPSGPPSSFLKETKKRKEGGDDGGNQAQEEAGGGEVGEEVQQEDDEDGSDEIMNSSIRNNPLVRLALYIALAHAGLALLLVLLYASAKLLEEYWRPIQWAVLCSMPLREIQTALVRFWTHPLQLGLFETVLAIPVAVFRSATATIIDSQIALLRLLPQRHRFIHLLDDEPGDRIGFSKLNQWLVSFGLFVFANERFGIGAIPMFAFVGFMAYAAGCSLGYVGHRRSRRNVASTLSAISFARRSRAGPRSTFVNRTSRYLTSGLLHRLKTIVGIGLISFMFFGSFFMIVFFSYKIGIEGKDAVLSLKSHLQESNYAERIGLTQWLDENDVPELIDAYTAKFYESISKQIDNLALQHNATEIVDGIKRYLIEPLESSFTSTAPTVSHQPFTEKLHNLRMRVQNKEWKVIFSEMDVILREFLALISREDLIEKVRDLVLQSVDVSKRIFASSTLLLAGSANFVFNSVVSIVLGAAGLFNFISQLMVFFWLLYYLITSESGGVLDQMLGVLPLSRATRHRCADVLGHAVSTVLLATAKIAFFQGCLTYLLFRFYRIHFLYMSTFLAFTSAFLPITPPWLSSIPAAAQLAVEGRFIEALFLTAVHHVLINFGVNAIQVDVPAQSAYLTGISMLGGMALLPSALEGAIMGPLLLTIIVALKNLYGEFVLTPSKRKRPSNAKERRRKPGMPDGDEEKEIRENSVDIKPLRKSLALNILLTMRKFRTSGRGLGDGLLLATSSTPSRVKSF